MGMLALFHFYLTLLRCQTFPDDLRLKTFAGAPSRARAQKKEKVWPKAPANVISLKSSENVWHLSLLENDILLVIRLRSPGILFHNSAALSVVFWCEGQSKLMKYCRYCKQYLFIVSGNFWLLRM